jgi:hypothetical protein
MGDVNGVMLEYDGACSHSISFYLQSGLQTNAALFYQTIVT